ncbi:hypothetical protein XELAEV_18033183mg [Xenopus laevis]|uniref:GIY-YIG domain-containing protein n=1 Tax=Xenopus laevis TaxID=8355 RepID=A0A974HDS8_XENLA|nr:hypothetical protein XELAEV_18033183mg [Xenopus laevis]
MFVVHPYKCIEGIPKGQYLRLRRICSSDEDFKEEAYKLYQRFKSRGYKTRCLHRAYQHALSFNREDLLYKSQSYTTGKGTPTNHDKTRLILTYSESDKERNTSIGDMITHSHFHKYSKAACCKMPGSFRCGACEQCHLIKISNNFGRDGSKYKVYHYTCCTTTYLVYLFTCHCGSMYVGKTKRPLKRRIYEHMRDKEL